MTQNEYYVYLYLREDGTPYYVGKGKGNRAYQKTRAVPAPKTNDRIIFAHTNLSEDDAFKKEIELILQYGRKNNGTGILRNLTDGGEGTSGFKWTSENKIKLSEGLKKAMTSERRAAISRSLKNHYSSLENRSERSKKMKEIHNTPEYKEKHSKIMKEVGNRPEVIKLKKETMGTPEYKEKHSKIMKEAQNRPEVKAKRRKTFNETIAKRKAEKLQASANLTEFFISDPIDR